MKTFWSPTAANVWQRVILLFCIDAMKYAVNDTSHEKLHEYFQFVFFIKSCFDFDLFQSDQGRTKEDTRL